MVIVTATRTAIREHIQKYQGTGHWLAVVEPAVTIRGAQTITNIIR